MRAPFLDISHPIFRLREEHIKGERKPGIRAKIFTWNPADPLADVFLAQFGFFPAPEDIQLDYAGFYKRHLNAEELFLGIGDPVPSDVFRAVTPSVVTGFDLEPDGIIDRDPGLYVGRADSFEDIVNFWNLRAGGVSALFFDFNHENRLGPLKDAFVLSLQGRPGDLNGFPPAVGVWSKEEGAAIDFAPFGEHISGGTVRDGLPGLRAISMQFRPRSILANVTESGGRPRIAFQLPEKPFREDETPFGQMFVVGIHPVLGFSSDLSVTLVTVFLPEMNDFYQRELALIGDEVRVQKDGFGIITSATAADISFFAIRVTEMIARIFELFGIHAEPSLAGRVTSRVIRQMGGLQGCRVFKFPGVRELIETHGPLQSFTRGQATRTIARLDQATNRPTLQRIFIDGKELTPSSAFDYLLKMKTFRVGVELNCPNCNLEFWLALEPLGHDVVCEYCGETLDVSTQLKDRDWRFRRSGLFGRDNHQEGAIPVVLTLQQLNANVHSLGGSCLFATSFTLSSAGAKMSPCETDLIVLVQDGRGRIQLALGECKSAGLKSEIDQADVDNLLRVANVFPPERMETFLIFSKTGSFSAAEIASCETAEDPLGRRVILLSDRELEPYYVYERTGKEYEIRPTAVSLTDLARATVSIFFHPKPKVVSADTEVTTLSGAKSDATEVAPSTVASTDESGMIEAEDSAAQYSPGETGERGK